jgi:hypothetical protein
MAHQRWNVFVSYAAEDKQTVSALVRGLKTHGLSVWCDGELTLGANLPIEVAEALSESRVCLVVMSRHSRESEWVKREIDMATVLEANGTGLKVVPLLLDGDCWPQFITRIFFDLSARETFEDAVAQLAQALKRVETADVRRRLLTPEKWTESQTRQALFLCWRVREAFNCAWHAFAASSREDVSDPGVENRVLLFVVDPDAMCVRLAVYVYANSYVIGCKHRFTLRKDKRHALALVARAWNDAKPAALQYSVEYTEDKTQYERESVEYGFDLARIAHIQLKIASALAIPIERLILPGSRGVAVNAVLCLDSVKRGRCPPALVDTLVSLTESIVNDFNGQISTPLERATAELIVDPRTMLDECGAS